MRTKNSAVYSLYIFIHESKIHLGGIPRRCRVSRNYFVATDLHRLRVVNLVSIMAV